MSVANYCTRSSPRLKTTAYGCVCLFTRIPDFFFRYGFREVEDRTALPDKIFKDCQNCPRLYKCDEVAMARGQVPKVSILGPRIEAEQLVRMTV